MAKKIFICIVLLKLCHVGKGQFLMDMLDTTTEKGRSMLNITKNFAHLRLSGYIQPQFQIAEQKGALAFEGGNFAPRVSNRFMFRRSRVKIDYVNFGSNSKPGVHIVFQFDANERGFTVRDVWGRVFENKYRLFSFTTGMFARPFGYEVNLSSSDRESPERGRMSQLLMRSERDLGAMVSLDSRKDSHALKFLRVDAGLFNGQGINASGDFDNIKDLIARISIKPVKAGPLRISAGTSILYGGLENNTKFVYTTGDEQGTKTVLVDSAATNIGKESPRHYYGADVQIKHPTDNWTTELRGEFLTGTQTGELTSTETPDALLTGNTGYHVREFRGGYAYFLQNIFSKKHQLVLKYDVYDPNTKVKGKEISASTGFTQADIKYSTLGFGYINYMTDNVKLVLYYAKVTNESTKLSGFINDARDDVFTCRLQFRF